MATRPDPTTSSPSPRRRGRRLRIAAALLVVLLVAAVAVIQLVLWSGIPRDLIISQLQNQLGVRVELGSVRTGWFGRTELTDLALTMPLADEPFLRAPSVRVRHTGLLMLILGRPLRIDAADVPGPSIEIAQQPTGRWNIQALGAGGGGSTSAPAGRSIDIPDLSISDATLRIIDADGRSSTIQSVAFTGRNEAAFVYALQLMLPPFATVEGRLNLRGLDHRLFIRADDLTTPLRPLVPAMPGPLSATGEWIGQVRGGKLQGLAHVQRLRAMAFDAAGDVRLELGPGGILLRPDRMRIEGGGLPAIDAGEGSVRVDGSRIEAVGLHLRTGDGDVRVDGQWDVDGGSAAVDATWHSIRLPATARHSGTLRARLEPQLGGGRRLQAELDVAGTVAAVSFNSAMTLVGSGRQWERMDWSIDASRLGIEAGSYVIDLDGLSARLLGRGDRIVLHHLALPAEGRLSGEGQFALIGNRPWTIKLSGNGLPISRHRDLTARFDLRAEGTMDRFDLSEASIRTGELTATARGRFDPAEAEPLLLEIDATHPAPRDLVLSDDPPLMGPLDASATVRGTVHPLDLKLQGRLVGHDLRTRRRQIGDVTIAFEGGIDPDRAQFSTSELDLLGGRWRFGGTIDQPTGDSHGRLHVSVQALPLDAAAEVLRLDGLTGALTAGWTITFPNLSARALSVEGALTATDVAYRPVRRHPTTAPTAEPLVAEEPAPAEPVIALDRIEARTTLRDRVLRIQDLQLHQADGRARGELVYRLAEPGILGATMQWTRWWLAVPHSPAALILDGSTRLNINFSRQSITGPIDLMADLTVDQDKLGAIALTGEFRDRGISLPTVRADLFGGRVWGRLLLEVDQPLLSQGVLQFADIDGSAIAATWPRLDGLAGRYRGVVELRPADPENRPVAPLRLSGFVDPADGHFRDTQIGPLDFDAYLDTRRSDRSDTASRLRIVLDRARLEAMGGIIDLWGRYTRHEQRETSAQANAHFEGISLNQFWQSFIEPGDDPVPGVLSGSATLLLDPTRPRASFGEAEVNLAHSDLVNVGAFSVLYDLLNIGVDPREPRGEGVIRLQLEGENARITRMNYFNRGVEVWAIGRFTRVWDIARAPVEATVVGTARPFRNLELPILADVQDILTILQRDLTTVRVSGTVDKPGYAQATFQQLGQTMRDILLGDAQAKAKRK